MAAWAKCDGAIELARGSEIPTYNGREGWETRLPKSKYAFALFALTTTTLWAQDTVAPSLQVHQVPDQDGVYYVGPEVTIPKMASTVSVPYPYDVPDKDLEGMTVLAMVIDSKGIPEHIQVLHAHGEVFDQGSIAAVKASKFEPGMLGGKPVPVWIDVRVVFHANRSLAVPQLLVTERDLPPPDESKLEDRHHHPLSYTPPFPLHTVDAGFADPFVKHPYVEVAVVSVLVGTDGLPKAVRVVRGLTTNQDRKAAAAVWHYRFLPAMNKGKPVEARRNVLVSFADF